VAKKVPLGGILDINESPRQPLHHYQQGVTL